MKEWEMEKPKRAMAVMPTLTAVTMPAPYFFVSLSLCREEMTVPTEMIMKMMPDQDTGTPSSG